MRTKLASGLQRNPPGSGMHRAHLARGKQRGLQSSARSGKLSIARLRTPRPPAGMQTRLSRRVFALWGAGVAASRKGSRARSGFRAHRELCSICRCPQADRPAILGKCCPSATWRAVAVAVSRRNLFFRPTRPKGPGRCAMRGLRGLFHDSAKPRSGPPQRLNRRAGTCPGLLGKHRTKWAEAVG